MSQQLASNGNFNSETKSIFTYFKTCRKLVLLATLVRSTTVWWCTQWLVGSQRLWLILGPTILTFEFDVLLTQLLRSCFVCHRVRVVEFFFRGSKQTTSSNLPVSSRVWPWLYGLLKMEFIRCIAEPSSTDEDPRRWGAECYLSSKLGCVNWSPSLNVFYVQCDMLSWVVPRDAILLRYCLFVMGVLGVVLY